MKVDAPHSTCKGKKRHRRWLPGLTVKDGFTPHPFDLEYGVRTSGLVAGRYLLSGHRNDRHSTAYYAVAPSVFREILTRWRRNKPFAPPLAPIDEYTFVDLGAGMGRAMLLAAEYPFRAVIGVELNPTLARIGRRNLALWRKQGRTKAPTRMLCRDAVAFELPPGPCVAFLFNPFGAPVMHRLFAAWTKTLLPREALDGRHGQFDVLYVNNEQENVLRLQPGFKRLFAGQLRRSRADAIADHKILSNQPDGEYASSNWEDCSIYRWEGLAPGTRK